MVRQTLAVTLVSAVLAGFGDLATVCAQTVAGFDVEERRNVMVAARDGVHLATDVYLPARNGATGQVPTIVERTPYNKDTAAAAAVKYFVPRGYAVVYQDVRG